MSTPKRKRKIPSTPWRVRMYEVPITPADGGPPIHWEYATASGSGTTYADTSGASSFDWQSARDRLMAEIFAHLDRTRSGPRQRMEAIVGEAIDWADPAAVKRAYRLACLKLHPDRNGGDDREFKELQAMRGVLGV